ncbi:MAG: aspartate/glutamate racemase family protein [Pseudomonadota bacterium]
MSNDTATPGPILVINPNSNEVVTEGMARALDSYRMAGGPEIETMTLAEGPFGIESQVDSDSVILPLVRVVQSRLDASAFVIACYSDPGLDACRSVSSAPVYGIQDSGILTAMAHGEQVGVIAISDVSIARHMRTLRQMGVMDRITGERALNMSVHETAVGTETFAALERTGRALMGDGADVIVLGCAGMATHRAGLEEALGIPVVDPTQAAVAMALGRVLLG